MALWDLVLAFLRRWPVVLVGALLTACAGRAAAADHTVYWTRTEVVLLAPSSRLYPNSLKTMSEDLIITAGVVAKALTGPDKVTKYASPDANLVGIGIREGWSVRLPDTGGQWAPNFGSQRLNVEVVGPDMATVRLRRDALIGRIAEELRRLQRTQHVDPRNDITSTVAPETAVIYHVGGSRNRSLVMIALLGAGATTSAVVVVEGFTNRRRRRTPVAAPATRKRAPVAPLPS